MDIFQIALGAAGVGVAYFVYLAATTGLPAALAWIKAKWNAGKAAAAALESRISTLEKDVGALKKASTAPAPQSAPAPAAPAV
jgi:hypothetical protein